MAYTDSLPVFKSFRTGIRLKNPQRGMQRKLHTSLYVSVPQDDHRQFFAKKQAPRLPPKGVPVYLSKNKKPEPAHRFRF